MNDAWKKKKDISVFWRGWELKRIRVTQLNYAHECSGCLTHLDLLSVILGLIYWAYKIDHMNLHTSVAQPTSCYDKLTLKCTWKSTCNNNKSRCLIDLILWLAAGFRVLSFCFVDKKYTYVFFYRPIYPFVSIVNSMCL